jgi:hypothetical protein
MDFRKYVAGKQWLYIIWFAGWTSWDTCANMIKSLITPSSRGLFVLHIANSTKTTPHSSLTQSSLSNEKNVGTHIYVELFVRAKTNAKVNFSHAPETHLSVYSTMCDFMQNILIFELLLLVCATRLHHFAMLILNFTKKNTHTHSHTYSLSTCAQNVLLHRTGNEFNISGFLPTT